MDAKREEIGALLIKKTPAIARRLRRYDIPGADVPDLVQEVLRRAFEYLTNHAFEGDLSPLLAKITRQVALDFKARARTVATYAPTLAEDDVAPSTPERELAEKQIHDRLSRTIDGMPSEVRDILRDKFVEDLEYKTIAEARRVSVSTVKRRVADFLAACEEALRADGITSPLVVPFGSAENDVDGPGSTREATDPRMALVAPVARPAAARLAQAPSRWWAGAKGAACAAAGGFLVWLFMRSVTPAAHVSPIVHVSAPLFTSYAASATLPARLVPIPTPAPVEACPVCPEAPPAPTCSTPSSSAVMASAPEAEYAPRYIARACEAALDRHDKPEIQKWCSRLSPGFRALLGPRLGQ